MLAGFGKREGSSDEAHAAMIGKIRGSVRAAVRPGDFRIAAKIDAAQQHLASVRIDEAAAFDRELGERHPRSLVGATERWRRAFDRSLQTGWTVSKLRMQ
jgi:hypothetical protein